MQIIDYFQDSHQSRWLWQIAACEWRAAKFLAELLQTEHFHAAAGRGTVYLLVDEGRIASFLTLSERDCIANPDWSPWIGFVHTAPEYRGRRLAGRLIEHACVKAREHGAHRVYIATDHVGLYEKYSFTYLESRKDIYGEDSRIYVREV